MNAKLLCALAAVSVAGLMFGGAATGCGDSGGSGGTGGTTSATTGNTTSSKATTGAGMTTTTGTGTATSTGTGASCQDMCISMHQAGYATLTQIVVQKCGCDAGSTCNTDCVADPACTDNMPNKGLAATGSPCETCVAAEGAKGSSSQCVLAAGTGSDCQGDADCQAFVICALGC